MSSGCQGVAWTYNEPSIWYEYTLDCAKLCKDRGLYTVYVTNGYATAEHLDGIGPYLDAYRVDIKSMNAAFYKKMAGVPSVDGILEIASRAKHKWGMHVECVTNIVPGENDSEDEVAKLAGWIVDHLGKQTPWHVTRFFPHSQMIDTPPTPISTIQSAIDIGRREGLQFVYPGNVDLPGTSNTICPECGSILVERRGYNTRVMRLDAQGCCAKDGQSANLRLSAK
jgi:pyruvate formate lyase activating enzyme